MNLKLMIVLLLCISILKLSATVTIEEIDSLKAIKNPDAELSEKIFFKYDSLINQYRHTNPNLSLTIAFDALQYAIIKKEKKHQGTYHNRMGNVFFDLGLYEKALRSYEKTLIFAKETKDTGAIAYSYTDIGYIFYKQGLYDISEKYYKESLKWSKELGTDECHAHSLNSMAWIMVKKNNIQSAMHFLEKAYRIRLDIGDYEKIGHSHTYLGRIQKDFQYKYYEAIDHFEQSINLFELSGTWPEGKIYNYIHLADAYAKIGKMVESSEYYQLAIKSFRDIGYTQRVISAKIEYANHLMNYKFIDEALKLAKDSYETATKNKYIYEALKASELLSKCYSKINDYKNESKFLKTTSALKDSINAEHIIRTSEIIENDLASIDQEIEQQEIENVSRIRMIVFIGIVASAIGIIILLFNKYKNEKEYASKLKVINQRLEQLNKELENANLTKDRFFSIIAHDLKNPIASLKGTIALLHKEFKYFDKEDIYDYLGQMKVQSASVQDLLENLLTWSRSQSGKVPFEPAAVDLQFIVDNNFDLLIGNAKTKDIILENNVPFGFQFDADVNMINTVLRNLISNAIKFTSIGGTVSVNCTKGENNIRFSVKDNGVGMPEEVRDKLFAFDTNVSTDGTNNEKGTGLGLVIVKEFIDKHNGKIWVESEVGQGTEFFISIPT